MGACCSKEGNYGDRQITVYEHECEQEDYVYKGDNGASIRLQGSSAFISMATQQGRKGINQDAMTVWEDFTGDKDAFFCGVFDGHGPCGHKVARNARDELPIKLSAAHKLLQTKSRSTSDVDALYADDDDAHSINGETNDNLHDGKGSDAELVLHLWKAAFLTSFREVDKELSQDSSIESYCSGTTAVTAVKQGDHLIIGNLGDSRAVMCTRGEKGQIIPLQLTVDLKPSLPREAERVRRCNGRVFSLEEESHVLRLWLPDEDSPGLAMTRAFGDFCLKDYGLISTPQVFYRKLTEQDEFIVLATDGVWDVLTNFEVVKIVSAARKRSHAAKFLATHAVRAWKSRFPSSRTDDIAVVCLFFKPPPPGKSMSDISHITPDSLSHLNSSVSQHTYRSISSDADEGFDFKDSSNNKGKFQEIPEEGEGESLVGTSLNFPRYTNSRNRGRPTSKSAEV
ncbi:probable protein phosphatase 2C 65 [Beta vulgaris subsp. vulgaris]|uniref:probable protein phosphatase 2C 65 n=1 Tax=Beta vulgaris subsp. vulgaris TaxID=3555 RepID=UPI0020370924|nr:probable protein phosphatase 2C 65 [Beta vulgaris subsp. vulgaris]